MKKANLSLFAAIFSVVFLAGCGSTPEKNKNWLKEHGGEIVNYSYTKAEIEAEIDAHWQEYGYSARPDKFIAISFDDGPCASSANGGTAAMLAQLDELNVKATFFVIGQNVRVNKAAAQAVFDNGHELGNHSDGYLSLGNADEEDIVASIDAASELIREITGKYPRFFRAPNLSHGIDLSDVCSERGMALIDGSAHNDWDGTGHTPESIKNSVLSNPRDGGILILHDNNTSKGDTMAALPDIVRGLREKGFWILTVGRLAAVKEKTLDAGKQYELIN